jgi:hypothetical protein
MIVATALGWGNAAQIATAIALAYLFGFVLTARPLVAAGLGADRQPDHPANPGRVARWPRRPVVLRLDRRRVCDRLPGRLSHNRYLIARGKGHAVVHHHGE